MLETIDFISVSPTQFFVWPWNWLLWIQWRIYLIYWEFCVAELSLLSHLVMYASIHLYPRGLTRTYFVLWFITQHYFNLQVKLLKLWPWGALPAAFCTLWHIPTNVGFSFFHTCLLSGMQVSIICWTFVVNMTPLLKIIDHIHEGLLLGFLFCPVVLHVCP